MTKQYAVLHIISYTKLRCPLQSPLMFFGLQIAEDVASSCLETRDCC